MTSKQDHPPRERAEFLCDTAGSILSVRIRGEIDHHTAAGIRQGIDRVLFERRPKRLILDLSAVSFMDSSGLGLIMGRFSVMKELGGEMTVWNPSRETRSILTLAGMERLVRIEYPSGTSPEDDGVLAGPPRTSSPRTSSPRASTPRASTSRNAPARTSPSPARGQGQTRKRKKTATVTALADRKEKDA